MADVLNMAMIHSNKSGFNSPVTTTPRFNGRYFDSPRASPIRSRRSSKTPRKKVRTPVESEPVEVFCRIRPLENPNEALCIKTLSDKLIQLLPNENSIAARNGPLKEYEYSFGHVFDEYTSQKAIFDFVALPLCEDLINGKNGLLFTYGITSSGKTYTMSGSPQDQGILPRCLDVLFNSIEGYQATKYVFKSDKMNRFEVQTSADAMIERQRRDILPGLTPKTPRQREKIAFNTDDTRAKDQSKIEDIEEDNSFAVFVSYIEIYNNYIYDLLEELPYDPITGHRPPQSKMLREDAVHNMYVHCCKEVEVKSPDDAFDLLFKGQKRRKVAHTALNAESSRSHSVFTIRLVQAPLDPAGDEVLQDPEKICVSQLSLVDLAGSERSSRTNNAGDRQREACNINQTLMTLRTCLDYLRENQRVGTNKMVPYRDSKITHLFKNYFDGEGKVRMVVCVNPKADEYDETIHVMKFAELTQEVLIQKAEQRKFDIGLTPGRRRMMQQYKEEQENLPEIVRPPTLSYNLGPDYPCLELRRPSDEAILNPLALFIDQRSQKRHLLLGDFENKWNKFRSMLGENDSEMESMRNKIIDLQAMLTNYKKMETKVTQQDKKIAELNRKLHVIELDKQDLENRLHDKRIKIQRERLDKDQMKSEFQSRITMNNQHWERNMEHEKKKMEQEVGHTIGTYEKKINALRSIVNDDKPLPVARSRYRTPSTPVTRLQAANSETDLPGSSSRPTPGRTPVTSHIPSAKSMHNLNRVISSAKPSIPVRNPRHRRSKSTGEDIWLDHRPAGNLEMDTVLQPKLKKKKSRSKIEMSDVQAVTKYCLTHQEQDAQGGIETKLIKGDCIPTVGGGRSVIYNDVEILKQISPGSRKRRSGGSQQPCDYDGEWTDTETRCATAIEGHAYKRTKHSAV